MKLKKTLNWILITVLVMILTACGGGGGSTEVSTPLASVTLQNEKSSYTTGEMIYFTTSEQDDNVTVTYENGLTIQTFLTNDGNYTTILPVNLSDGNQTIEVNFAGNTRIIDLVIKTVKLPVTPIEYNQQVIQQLITELENKLSVLSGDELISVNTQIQELENYLLQLSDLSDEDQLALSKLLASLEEGEVPVSSAKVYPSFKTTTFLDPLMKFDEAACDNAQRKFVVGMAKVTFATGWIGGLAISGGGLLVGAPIIGIPSAPFIAIAMSCASVKWGQYASATGDAAGDMLKQCVEYRIDDLMDELNLKQSAPLAKSIEVSSLEPSQSVSGQPISFTDGVANILSITTFVGLSDERKALIETLKSAAEKIDSLLPDSLVPNIVTKIKNIDTSDKEVTISPSQLSIVSISDSRITGQITGTDVSQFTFSAGEDVTEETSFSFTVQGMDEAGSTIVHRETINATFIPVLGDVCTDMGGEINSEGVCIVLTYWDNGTVKDEIPYVNGVIVGIVKRYHYTLDFLMSETPYVNGVIEGIVKTYYASSDLLSETPYVDGVIQGIQRWYYSSGALREELSYVNGVVQGIVYY